jgi:hypothetical protein
LHEEPAQTSPPPEAKIPSILHPEEEEEEEGVPMESEIQAPPKPKDLVARESIVALEADQRSRDANPEIQILASIPAIWAPLRLWAIPYFSLNFPQKQKCLLRALI